MSLAFVRGIHQWLVDSPHKGPVTIKMFPFDDVIICQTVMAYWSFRNRLQWNLNQNTTILIQDNNEFENVVCKIAAILFRPPMCLTIIPEGSLTSCGWQLFLHGDLWSQEVPLWRSEVFLFYLSLFNGVAGQITMRKGYILYLFYFPTTCTQYTVTDIQVYSYHLQK